MSDTYKNIYKAHGPGWDKLTNPCIDLILNYGGEVYQVKEKFGGLRIYYTCPREHYDIVDMAVAKAETDSYRTCEACGEPGKPGVTNYWWRTLCPTCREEEKHALRNSGRRSEDAEQTERSDDQ